MQFLEGFTLVILSALKKTDEKPRCESVGKDVLRGNET